MSNVDNKDNRATSVALFWCLYWTYFTAFSSVSINKFKQVDVCWLFHLNLLHRGSCLQTFCEMDHFCNFQKTPWKTFIMEPVCTKVAGHSAIISKVCSFEYVFKGIFMKFKISFSVEFEWKAGFSNFLLNISHKICFLCFKLVSPEQMFENNDYLQMICSSLWDCSRK